MEKIVDKTIVFVLAFVFPNLFYMGGCEYYKKKPVIVRQIPPGYVENYASYWHYFHCGIPKQMYLFPPWIERITLKWNNKDVLTIPLDCSGIIGGEGRDRTYIRGCKCRSVRHASLWDPVNMHLRDRCSKGQNGEKFTWIEFKKLTCNNNGDTFSCVYDLFDYDEGRNFTDVVAAETTIAVKRRPRYPVITSELENGDELEPNGSYSFTCNTTTSFFYGSGYFYWQVLHNDVLKKIPRDSELVEEYMVKHDKCGNTTWSHFEFNASEILDIIPYTESFVSVTCGFRQRSPKYPTSDRPGDSWRATINLVMYPMPKKPKKEEPEDDSFDPIEFLIKWYPVILTILCSFISLCLLITLYRKCKRCCCPTKEPERRKSPARVKRTSSGKKVSDGQNVSDGQEIKEEGPIKPQVKSPRSSISHKSSEKDKMSIIPGSVHGTMDHLSVKSKRSSTGSSVDPEQFFMGSEL